MARRSRFGLLDRGSAPTATTTDQRASSGSRSSTRKTFNSADQGELTVSILTQSTLLANSSAVAASVVNLL